LLYCRQALDPLLQLNWRRTEIINSFNIGPDQNIK
jgi:hypothetical protein